MEFHKKLRQLRMERGMTQEDLAAALGLSRQSVSKWESGQGLPEAETLVRLSDTLGVSLDHLLKGAPENAPEAKAPVAPAGGRKTASVLRTVLLVLLGLLGLFIAIVVLAVFFYTIVPGSKTEMTTTEDSAAELVSAGKYAQVCRAAGPPVGAAAAVREGCTTNIFIVFQ